MRMNKKTKSTERTYEGGPAFKTTGMEALRRAVSSCFLWEDEFYEDGVSIAKRIQDLAMEVPINDLADLAIEARTVMNLRHVSLWLANAVIDRRMGSDFDTAAFLEKICQRADEPGEILAMYWKNGRKPVPAAVKRGLGKALLKFDEYQLAKWNRKTVVTMKDVVRVTHPKPDNDEKNDLIKRLLEDRLETPDTWEVQLSAGKDKKETFERLIAEGKLGYLALLRNLRNMEESKVKPSLIRRAILERKGAKNVLPFRYVAAARAVPRYEKELDEALIKSLEGERDFDGETIVLVDVSGSMDCPLSQKSDLKRIDAAATLASIIRGNVRVFTFSDFVKEEPYRLGMAGIDTILKSQPRNGTRLGSAIKKINTVPHDRLIVISDEQTSERVPDPEAKHAYMINVASYEKSLERGRWMKISGFSENVIRWIKACEE